jgi:hypothetical protein
MRTLETINEHARLTWDELAKIYREKTGKSAYICSIMDIYNWAIRQDFIQVHEDSSLSLKIKSE